jgi:hypothetical protein
VRSASGTGRPQYTGKIEHGTGWGRESCDESSDCVWVCSGLRQCRRPRVGACRRRDVWGWPRAAPPCRIISAGGGEITISGEPSSLGDRVLPLTSAPRKKGAVYKAIPKQPPLPHPLLHHPRLHLLAMPEGRSRLGRGEGGWQACQFVSP